MFVHIWMYSVINLRKKFYVTGHNGRAWSPQITPIQIGVTRSGRNWLFSLHAFTPNWIFLVLAGRNWFLSPTLFYAHSG